MQHVVAAVAHAAVGVARRHAPRAVEVGPKPTPARRRLPAAKVGPVNDDARTAGDGRRPRRDRRDDRCIRKVGDAIGGEGARVKGDLDVEER